MMGTASSERIEHALQVLSSMENMKSRGFICDFVVKVEDQLFDTHRAVLAACSGYFEALFSSNMKETKDGYIMMKDIDANAVDQCIRYMYSGTCEMVMDTIPGILHAADLLQLQQLKVKCFIFLQNNIQSENCILIRNLARMYNCHDLEKEAENYVFENLKEVISSRVFLDISRQDVSRYIVNADCQTSWQAVITWSSNREKEFEILAEQIDFSKFSFHFLFKNVISEPLVVKSEKIKISVIDALFLNQARLEENLNSDNCFMLKELARRNGSQKVIETYMARNLSKIFRMSPFVNLSKNEVIAILESSGVESEKSKWEAVLKWVKNGSNRSSSSKTANSLPLKCPEDEVNYGKSVDGGMTGTNAEVVQRKVANSVDERESNFLELAKRMKFSKFSFKFLLENILKEPLVANCDPVKLSVVNALFSNVEALEENLSPQNSFQLNKLATDEHFKKFVKLFMRQNFTAIVSYPQFCDLSKEDAISLINDAEVESEKFRWEAILKWVNYDSKHRAKIFPRLFCAIKLGRLSSEYLQNVVRADQHIKNSADCTNVLLDFLLEERRSNLQLQSPLLKDETEDRQFIGSSKLVKERESLQNVTPVPVCELRQPPGGRLLEVFDPSGECKGFMFEFDSGVFKEIHYPHAQFCGFVPLRWLGLVENGLKAAFNSGAIFKLKYKQGSRSGVIDWGGIKLCTQPDRAARSTAYHDNLMRQLQAAGFGIRR